MGIFTRVRDALKAVAHRGYVFFTDNFTSRARVDSAGALFSVAFLACELVKMRAIGSLPFHVYRNGPKGPERVPEHAVERLFSRRWNNLQTAAEGIRATMLRVDVFGDAYVRLVLDRMGNPLHAYLITSQVTPLFDALTDTAAYRVGPGDDYTSAGDYPAEQILHFKSPVSTDGGITGRSLVELAAEEIGLTIDLERYYALMISNGQHFPGYYTTDQPLSQKEFDGLKAEIEKTSGVDASGRSRVFTKGVSWKQNPVSIGDASLVEQQTWHLQQLCRVTSVPPQKVYDLSHATYSNVEQGAIAFVQDSVLPIVRDWELVIDGCFRASGEKGLYGKFEISGLLRGTFRDRMESYRIGRFIGLFSVNDICHYEDMPDVPGGDSRLVPLNYAILEADGTLTVPNKGTGSPASTDNKPDIAPIEGDAYSRVRERIARDGDCERTRDFAAKVIYPIARAYLLAGRDYDMDATIERMFDEPEKEE